MLPAVTRHRALNALIDQTLRFTWNYGAVVPVGSHSTGWRSSASAGMVQIQGIRTLVERRDRPPCWAEDGSAIVIGGHDAHCLTSTQLGPTAGVCRYASVDFQVLSGIDVLTLYDLPAVVTPPRAQLIGDACAGLARIASAPPPTAIAHAATKQALGLHLLAVLLQDAPMNESGSHLLRHSPRMEPVLSYIDQHLDRRVEIRSLVRLSGLSLSRFHAVFRQVMREPPMTYLARRRIQRAQQLLVTTDQAIKDIAQAVGYDDAFHFSKAFRRHAGMSPLQYRRSASPWWPTDAATPDQPRP
jgi:AraC-like DNA-binding protein